MTAHNRLTAPWRGAIDNPYALLALAGLCWSGNHVIGRAIAGEVPPIGISTLRWLLPLPVIWLLARQHLRRDWPAIRAHWRVMLWLGATGGALFSALQYVGLQYTSAVNVSVLNSLVPVLIVAAGAAIFRDRVSLLQLFGVVVSLSGVLIMVTRGSLSALTALDFNAGDLIIVLNMAVFAIYAACLRLRAPMHPFSFLFVLAAISAAATFPFFVWESQQVAQFKPTLLTVAAILYVSIFPSVIAFAAWNRGVELIGANRSGPFLHLIPVYTALVAATFLGERLAAFHIAGFAAILVGVWLASIKGRKEGTAPADDAST